MTTAILNTALLLRTDENANLCVILKIIFPEDDCFSDALAEIIRFELFFLQKIVDK